MSLGHRHAEKAQYHASDGQVIPALLVEINAAERSVTPHPTGTS